MSKSDKELAVDLTVATLQAIATQTNKDGAPIVKVPDQKDTVEIFKGYYNSLSSLL
ncbi:hypothetical protein [Latilactobacillus phage TMW 1.46 P2]|uniref:hypothetical protein n=1 Tax=Latilactobacillus sakei TaxID=1599 RepID=UPI002073A218|nr:hypothetical protein [Latilactobacillus sakei]WAX23985.1 hypothetical protein [Latilactobacillus phage TMW 1.46 P2]